MKTIAILSDLELALVGLIREAPRSGYALRKIVSTNAYGHLSDSPGALYPALRRLQKAGLIEGVVDSSDGRRAEVFKLTPAGRRALRSALEAPVTEEEVARNPDRQILRFAFMELELTPDQVAAFVEAYGIAATRHAQSLRDTASLLPAMPPHPRLALDHAVELASARARWAAKAVKALGGR
jgi:DNA-binding PadR family transcriptional regulator